MSRRYAWIGILFAVALALFFVPLLSPPAVRAPSPAPRSHVYKEQSEKVAKESLIASDMAATELLVRRQSQKDAAAYLAESESPNGRGEQRAVSLDHFRKTHPEIEAVAWVKGDSVVLSGSSAAGVREAASAYWERGMEAARGGRSYASDVFVCRSNSKIVLAEPSPTGKSGLVMLLSAGVVEEVKRHQLRNLRVVPYPPEGRYRIESVLPNTNRDTTVRSGEDNGNASHYAVDEIVVKFRKPLDGRQLLQIRRELDVTVVKQLRQTYVFRSKKHEMKRLMAYFRKFDPVYIEPHYLYLTNGLPRHSTAAAGTAGVADNNADVANAGVEIVPNDTLYAKYQWNLPVIATERGWNVNKGSQDVVVAVVDTGVQSDHPDLKNRLVPGINIVDPSSPPDDDVGHGTHVAGIIAADVNNGEGVAGMTWYTKIMPVKALDGSGAGSTYSVAQGIIWAADHGANVINMSLGNYAEAEFLHDALKYAHDKGVVLVAASGNDNTDRPGYPAAYPEVVAVAATDPDSTRAPYSNYGDYIDVAAPGTSIASTYPGSRYASLSGTSMASPHVAALASLIRSANPDLSADEVADTISRTAKDLGDSGKDASFGNGQIDVDAALRSTGATSGLLQLYPSELQRRLQDLFRN